MEMLEDVLLEEEEVMTEVTPQKYLYRRREEIVLSDKDIMRINELVRNRKGKDRFIKEGYLTIEESRQLCHEIVDERRKELAAKNRVIIENGEIKTIFNEETLQSGYMSVEECRYLLHESIDRRRELLRHNAA
ncbi:hypothetical protein FACS189434_05950 [Bacteroidia bacterium]|nr:hypothetical protein FACS189434_05950 [Bacteroidia bacterium]